MPIHLLPLLLCLTLAQTTPVDNRPVRDRIIEKFDADGDGKFSPAERDRARNLLKEISRRADQPPIAQTLFPDKADLYRIAPGPHDVSAIASHVLHDPRRDRDIPLRITFPTDANVQPLIILCHGALGSKDGYQPLARYWASHGYVVIQPTFADSISTMTDDERKQINSVIDLLESPRTLGAWDQRPREVSYLLDSLEQLEKDLPQIKNRIDRQRIAVAGHSYGAHTTMLLAGMTVHHPVNRTDHRFDDPRIKAFVAISPQGAGPSLNAASYQSMNGPMLMITGDHDGSPRRGQEGKAGTWRREAFDAATAENTWLLWINNAHHGFGGIAGEAAFPGSGPKAPDQIILIQSTTLAFLDTFLRDNPTARAYLSDTEQFAKRTNHLATLTLHP